MATYLIAQGCGDEDVKSGDTDTGSGVEHRRETDVKSLAAEPAATGRSGCGEPKKKVVKKRLLREEDLRQLLARELETAVQKERERRLQGLADGRLAYLQETHYTSDWKETGEDCGEFKI